jgi:hypothetical protein
MAPVDLVSALCGARYGPLKELFSHFIKLNITCFMLNIVPLSAYTAVENIDELAQDGRRHIDAAREIAARHEDQRGRLCVS